MAQPDTRRTNTTQFDPSFEGLTDTQALFLRYFLDAENPDTFMRASPSARAAGVRPDSGHGMKVRLAPIITQFLEESGLGEDSLRQKLAQLLETHTDKVITMKGDVQEWELPGAARVLARSADADGNTRTVVAIRARAPELQLRALDMAMKHRGMYAPQQVAVTGLQDLVAAVAEKSGDLLSD
jgi:hypothetical protein